MKLRTLCAALLAGACLLPGALAENDGDCLYTLLDAGGGELTMRAARMYVGDEYISGDDQLYRVVSADFGVVEKFQDFFQWIFHIIFLRCCIPRAYAACSSL